MEQPLTEDNLSERYFYAFGRIVWVWADLEMMIMDAVARLLQCPPERAEVTLWHTSYKDRRDALRVLIELEELNEEIQEEFDCLIKRMNAGYSIRNTVAHCVWYKGKVPKTITPDKMSARGKIKLPGYNVKEEEYTAEQLIDEARKIDRLRRDFAQFMQKHFQKSLLPPAKTT